MSLQSDFEGSYMNPEEYLRLIWAETEITEDAFENLDDLGYIDSNEVKQTVYEVIRENVSSDERRTFYRRLLADYSKLDGGRSFDDYCQMVERLPGEESAKREALARMMTRVLRGELTSGGVANEHRPLQEATSLLQQTHHVDPWSARLNRLFEVEQGMN